jgi:hypothetical protein
VGIDEATHTETRLRELVEALRAERDQLAQALESRVIIEQAKGVLAERYRVPVDEAFLLLRQSARAARMKIHDLAAEVVRARVTPNAIIRGFARDSRWRALVLRERTEALRERNIEIQTRQRAQVERFERERARFTEALRVRTRSRWDAIELGSRLVDEDWFLACPDEEHWEVVVDLERSSTGDSGELSRRIEAWVEQRGGEASGFTMTRSSRARPST